MRESIGGSQLFMIVIVLLLLFTAFLCLSINYTAAYKVSDSIINTIKRDEGYVPDNVSQALQEAHYVTRAQNGNSVCPNAEWTQIGLDGEVSGDNKPAICVKKTKVSEESMPDMYYYTVKVFYRVDVPILSSFSLSTTATTPNIYTPSDDITIVES